MATESVLAVQRLSRGEVGQLNISYLSNFDFELLPETLRAFRLSFPHVALNLFDMTPAEQLRALEARKIDLGFIGLPPAAQSGAIHWESIAQHRTVVVLSSKHPLARKRQLRLGELESLFFVGMSEKTHPGFREWLNRTCHNAGFTPRVLQDAELEPALMTFVAEGLGVTLARENIKKLPHPGVAFRPLVPTLKSDYCIAWNRNNDSRALQQYIEVVKGMTRRSE
jgi:DNA-binding transcriptional LysR family regulator